MTLAAVDMNLILTTVTAITALIVALLKHLGKQAEARKVQAMVEAIEEESSGYSPMRASLLKARVKAKATSMGVQVYLEKDVERLTRKFDVDKINEAE